MKKLILFMIMIMMSLTSIYAGSIQFATSQSENRAIGYASGTDEKHAQSFISNGEDPGNITLSLKKFGSPGDNTLIRIETDSSGSPSGTLVDANAQISFATSTLSTSFTDVNKLFPGSFSLVNGTKYWVVVGRSGSFDNANGAQIYVYRTSDQYAGGDWAHKDSSWIVESGDDFYGTLYTQTQLPNPQITFDGVGLINNSYHNTSSLDIQINISTSETNNNTNISYSLDGASLIQFITNNLTGTLSLSSLTEGEHEIYFYAYNNETNATEGNYTFTIDLTAPNISIIGAITQDFEVDFSTVFNVTDALSGLASCTLTATYLENVTNASSYDRFANCTDVVHFAGAGLYNGYLVATDNAGNVETLSINGTVQPFVYNNFFYPNATQIQNYSVTIFHPDGQIEIITDTSNPVNISPYHNDSLDLGNYTIQFEKIGLATTNVTVPINETSGGIIYNWTIQISTLYVNIRDRNTEALITQTVDFDLVGDSFADTYSTTTGLKTINDIVDLPGQYRLSFSSLGYANNEYYFQHTGYSAVNITVYLINESETIPIKIILRDIFQKPKEECIIKVKQHFISINDYLVVDMGTTNSLGEIIFDLEYDKFYQFVAVCGDITQTYPGQKITSTPLYLEFDEDQGLTVFDELPNIRGDVTWANLTNTTGYFRFEYDDTDNIVSQGCLRVYEQAFSGDTLIDESCVNSASATINVLINYTTNKKYIGKGYATYNTEEHFIDSETKSFYPGSEGWSAGVGLIGSVLVIMTLFLIGMALHPIGAVGFAWLGTYVMVKFGALAISEGSVVGLGALLIGIVLFVRNR